MHLYYAIIVAQFQCQIKKKIQMDQSIFWSVNKYCTYALRPGVWFWIIDHPRSCMVYNFGRICLSVRLFVRR